MMGVLWCQVPLIGWIGRLDHQKGPDITLEAVPGLAARGCQVFSIRVRVRVRV
jgi:glycogen synthase